MPNIFFASNVRHLRELKQLKPVNMLDILGFKRSTWSGYEAGDSTPNLSDLMRIADFFGVTETQLLHDDLTKGNLIPNNSEPKKRAKGNLNGNGNGNLTYQSPPEQPLFLHEHFTAYGGAAPQVVTVNNEGVDNILYVPVRAQAGYLVGFGDPQYIETLPTFRMPGLSNRSYRMFEVEGVSMAPTLSDRDRVICEWVPSLNEVRENRVHVVIHRDGVAIKRVLNRVPERGKIYLKSDTLTHRANYPIKEIHAADILELWYVNLKVSSDLSEPAEIYHRVADLEVTQHEILKHLGLSLGKK